MTATAILDRALLTHPPPRHPGTGKPEARMPDQRTLVAFLSSPEAFGGAHVTRIDTHISHVFLAGERAYKLKRALRAGFVDYSTIAKRRAACEREVEINRRTAPELYLGVTPVTQSASGRLQVGGSGRPVDWLVEMVRFGQDQRLDAVAQAGRLSAPLVTDLAAEIARMHQAAPRRPDQGGAAELARVAADVVASLDRDGDGLFALRDIAAFGAFLRKDLAAQGGLMEARRRHGFVRHCHGDLHLANVCLIGGHPLPFDAIEFDDRLACTDTMYDLAFPIMDLMKHGLPDHANLLMNRYLQHTQDYGGLSLLRFCLALRGAVRARVLAMAVAAGGRTNLHTALEARTYFGMARQLAARPHAPLLIAIGGLSGTGKTTLARGITLDVARLPGAVVLHSDAIRKGMFGASLDATLGPEAYTPVATVRVYRRMFKQARQALRAGQTVIADATFRQSNQRAAMAAAAADSGAPFRGLWLDAPADAMSARVHARPKGMSDATPDVVARQLAADTGLIFWRRIDAGGTAEAVRVRTLAALAVDPLA